MTTHTSAVRISKWLNHHAQGRTIFIIFSRRGFIRTTALCSYSYWWVGVISSWYNANSLKYCWMQFPGCYFCSTRSREISFKYPRESSFLSYLLLQNVCNQITGTFESVYQSMLPSMYYSWLMQFWRLFVNIDPLSMTLSINVPSTSFSWVCALTPHLCKYILIQ